MGKVKIIFSDFDDTILHFYGDKNKFSSYQLGVIRKLSEKGLKFCLVTGRNIPFFRRNYPEIFAYVDYILASNGAIIYDVKNDEFIYERFIGEDSFSRIVRWLREMEMQFMFNSLDKVYQVGEVADSYCDNYVEGERYCCEQIIARIDDRDKDDFCNFLSSLHDICVNNVVLWNNMFSLDINDAGVSKGNAVKWLCQFLSIDKDEAIAFGDGENDLSLFKEVGTGIAVGNACDNIKKFANDVSLKCDEDGVFKYLEDNVLK